ncbi:hypothetical protein LO762_00915 [Actinocorallia sp. API 0066]|uniref:hypothetical protein n=1 Tax=Actinocorallia sp. API 0066 TaxID=2896846 RepID=UPI001E431459|nr:hypothetical protein [Actinocorallia sp. API 0066]MCD0447762.1 hypothetical protein [Actinocorallia sp. API 0066]
MKILLTWIPHRTSQLLTAVTFVVATTLSALVNVWTEGWAWPVGVGIVVLVVCQILTEIVRAGDTSEGPPPSPPLHVEQVFRDVSDSEVSGIARDHVGGAVDVRQRFQNVSGSRVVGVSEVDRI